MILGGMVSILIGTNRAGSNTRKVALRISECYADLGEKVRVIDLGELPPELFAPSAYAEKPAAFKPFADAVLHAAGLVVVCPEYNGGFPGVLKYFIDMLPFPESFERRPVAFVGLAAGQFGALRPVEQLQQIFGYRNAHIYPSRVFIPGVTGVLNDDGSISDEKLVDRLRDQAKGFAGFVRALNA